jgi:hypothetical protein
LFYDNESGYRAGALMIGDGSTVKVENSVFVDNESDWGGAIYLRDESSSSGGSELTVQLCTIYRNHSTSANLKNAGGIFSYTGYDTQTVLIANSIIAYNLTYGSYAGGYSGSLGGYVSDVEAYSSSYFTGRVADTYTRRIGSYYVHDSFSGSREGVNGTDWPGHSGTDKDMYFTSSSGDAIGKAGLSTDVLTSSSYLSSVDANGVTRPQGTGSDIGAYEYRNTWVGGHSGSETDWNTPQNWSLSTVPTTTANDSRYDAPLIEDVANDPVISGDFETDNLMIESGGNLTIAQNGSIKLTGNLINNGSLTMQSAGNEFSSLIVEGDSYGETKHWYNGGSLGDDGKYSGNITYNRYVNIAVDSGSNEWDLVGSPVDGLSISSFVTTNSSAIATSGSTYALGYYDNSNDSWTNYTTSTAGGAGNFTLGKGYQMASASGATMAFTGTVPTSTQTQSVINNADSSGRRWNLVANPFPSYINLNDNNDASNNFLTVNSSIVDGSFLAVYGYDADGTGYTIYNHAGDSGRDYIAPGQAFFIAAASSSAANISFTTAMRTTTGGDDFVSGRLAQSTHSSFYLKLYEDDDFIADSKFYFDNGLTLGLDPGYDAGALDQNMAIMSRLPQQDQGIGMSINAMSNESFEETIIPLDINKEAGIPFRISLEDATIPEGVEVYLEDTLLETLTDLKDVDFTLTPESDLSGIGRFYVRLGNTNLGNNDLTESHISIYKPFNQDHITI